MNESCKEITNYVPLIGLGVTALIMYPCSWEFITNKYHTIKYALQEPWFNQFLKRSKKLEDKANE